MKLKNDLHSRKEYLQDAISKIETTPPIPGQPQDSIEVSREAMIYVLQRALDGVDIAYSLNETINDHNQTF